MTMESKSEQAGRLATELGKVLAAAFPDLNPVLSIGRSGCVLTVARGFEILFERDGPDPAALVGAAMDAVAGTQGS